MSDTQLDDITLVDDYLTKWDLFAQGSNEFAPFLRDHALAFQSALTRLLTAKDRRAPGRLVFYLVVQVGGALPTDSPLGRAALAELGTDFPVTDHEGRQSLFAADLYFWWLSNATRYEEFTLFKTWAGREFARTVVVPMYNATARRK